MDLNSQSNTTPMLSRRRGDSDDEGAAPPVNHRNATPTSGLDGGSCDSHFGALGEGNRSAPFAGEPWHDNKSSSNTQQYAPVAFPIDMLGLPEGSGHTSRYVSKSEKLPSRWVLDPQNRHSTSSQGYTNLKVSHGPSGDPTMVTAAISSDAPSSSNGAAGSECLVVSNHSIPVEYLKEMALKNGDQQSGLLDDPMSGTGTIDQMLSNLRSKPFGASNTAKRTLSASLYPTLSGERPGGLRERSKSSGSATTSSAGRPKSPGKNTISPVYYFEIFIQALPEDAVVSVGMVICDGENSLIPGEAKNSIGLTSKGELKVSGRSIDEKKFSLEGFAAGDMIGCGVEVVGTRRILFTKNGKTIVPPTRFQDVEFRYNAYSPSMGIAMAPNTENRNAVVVKANFGGSSGLAFQWEESESSHVVNSSVSQLDQKKPPALSASCHAKSVGGFASYPLPMETEQLEQHSAPPAQLYNFGKPSRGEGLMASAENMPLPNGMLNYQDDGEAVQNDAAYENGRQRSGTARKYQGPQHTLPGHGSEASSFVPAKPHPTQSAQYQLEEESQAKDWNQKSPTRRGLFGFGKSSKKSSPPASTPERYTPASTNGNDSKPKYQTDTWSNSNSPMPGYTPKQNKSAGLMDDDENDVDPNLGEFQRMAAQTVGAAASPAAGEKKKNNSLLDDDNQGAGNVATGGASSTPLFFGKKSKKSNLDDDNPDDVQLQTHISNSFPATAQTLSSTASGPAKHSATTGMAPAAQTRSNTLPTYGNKASRSSLEDDEPEDTRFGRNARNQTQPASSPSNRVGQSHLAQLAGAPQSDHARPSLAFGTRSKRNSLEDDDDDSDDDDQYQSHAQMAFGSKSRRSDLENDDDPDDARYNNQSAMASGFNLGLPSKKGTLEDDDPEDDQYQNFASLDRLPSSHKSSPKKSIPNNHGSQDIANSTASQRNARSSQNGLFGSRITTNDLEDGGPPGARFSSHGPAFGTPSRQGTLEEDDPGEMAYQSQTNRFGSRSSNNLEDDEPDDFRYQGGAAPGRSASGRPAPAISNIDSFNEAGQFPRHSPTRPQSGPSRQRRATETFSGAGRGPTTNRGGSCHHSASPSTRRGSSPVPPARTQVSTTSSPSAHVTPQGASEDDMLNAAIEESKRDQKKQEMKADSGALKDPAELETIKENTRTIRSLCSDEKAEVDASLLQSLLDYCREDQAKVQACLESDDPQVDLMELLTLNELTLDAIKMGEKVIQGLTKKPSAATPASANVSASASAATSTSTPTSVKSSKSNLNLDIGALVEKKDIFSLICILRAQSDQRLDAAMALMNFAREADSLAEAGTRSLRDEIRSSGGMHSLITVFRSKGASYELRVVSALAVAYVLPSFVESSSVHPSVGLKIMECLRFLSTSRVVSPNGRRISREEMYKAAAMGVTTFWINELTPMLNAAKGENAAERSDLFARTSKKGKRRGRTGGQRHQTLELQELLEMTVSLIVQIEKLGETDSLIRNNEAAKADSLFLWRYTNVEQVCAVDVARPIAVREGLLPILVGWIRSKDREKVRPAVSALRYLTSIKDKYMAGWIHSQMVNEGALAEVVKLADDYYVGQDVRLAVAQILASLCVAPHTRAAVVEAKCINYLIGFLYDHSDKASLDVALFAGSAILQLAEGAITRASVLGGGETELQDGATPDKSDALVE